MHSRSFWLLCWVFFWVGGLSHGDTSPTLTPASAPPSLETSTVTLLDDLVDSSWTLVTRLKQRETQVAELSTVSEALSEPLLKDSEESATATQETLNLLNTSIPLQSQSEKAFEDFSTAKDEELQAVLARERWVALGAFLVGLLTRELALRVGWWR